MRVRVGCLTHSGCFCRFEVPACRVARGAVSPAAKCVIKALGAAESGVLLSGARLLGLSCLDCYCHVIAMLFAFQLPAALFS